MDLLTILGFCGCYSWGKDKGKREANERQTRINQQLHTEARLQIYQSEIAYLRNEIEELKRNKLN